MTPDKHKSSVLIGVCTYKRPKMLENCLKHIEQLKIGDLNVSVIVVNNDTIELSDIITSKQYSLPVQFTQSLTRGIPHARNEVLKFADEGNYEYCLFLDDDEYPNENWVTELVNKALTSNAHVVQGEVYNDYEYRPWIFKPLLKNLKFNYALNSSPQNISTCNVLMVRELFSKDKFALKFDQRYALTGGSDKEFFKQAILLHSIKTTYSSKAFVYEKIPKSRTTLAWFIKRFSRVESNYVLNKYHSKGYFYAFITPLPKHILNVITASFAVIIIIPSLLYPPLFRIILLKLIKILAKLIGYIASLCGKPIQAYNKTSGS